ncbi:cyclophilin family peptidyl-prolyl cis-trans isomerase/predicted small lipoprotein YifL [Paenibacillus sp. DS2015]|uniref:peptidylprolyl isomerase n=1 Tax=Paenibacillus sp. DS2015 TaxID=3373917 RepID=UPI003D214477
MKKKRIFLSLIMVMSVVLLLAACGKNETAAEEQVTEPTEQTGQTTPAPMSWDKPPAMEIDINKTYQAEVTTSKGTFTIDLYAKDAPLTVNNFVFLAKQGFYEGILFHRIMESFMIQTGDPNGNGSGGPGYSFEDEKPKHEYEPGIVAMANAGANTNGSQFFICTGADSTGLQPNYNVFGKISTGMDVVMNIAATPVESGEVPLEKVTINDIKITEK